jgi:hypothetical protein
MRKNRKVFSHWKAWLSDNNPGLKIKKDQFYYNKSSTINSRFIVLPQERNISNRRELAYNIAFFSMIFSA